MAPLTWREVGAPTFSGVAESQRLAADLINRSTSGLDTALGNFQEGRQKKADSAYLADISKFTDPGSLDQALRSGVAGNDVSADALKYGLEHRRQLLGDQTIQINNEQSMWNNNRVQENEAGRPAALARVNEIRSLASQGTPEAMAQARELMSQSSDVFAAAGMRSEDIMNMVNGNMSTATAGLATNEAFQKWGDYNVNRGKGLEADKLFADVMRSAATPEEGAQMIRSNPDLDPDVATIALAKITGDQGSALFGGAVDPSRVIMDEQLRNGRGGGGRIIYENGNATRNRPLSDQLTGAISPVLDELGITMKVVSGGQVTEAERQAGKGGRVGSERHDGGHAGDVDFYLPDGTKLTPKNPSHVPILQEIVRRGRARGITGWGEGEDYMGDGRVHLGFGSEAAWGKGGKSANAPQWLKEAMGAPLGQAPAAGPGQEASNAIDRALRVTADNASPRDSQSLLDATSFLNEQAQTQIDQGVTDEIFNDAQPVLAELTDRPNRNALKADIVNRLYGEIGDSNFSVDELTDQLNRVMSEFNLPADVAATLMKSAVQQNTWGTRWLSGDRSFDQSEVGRYFRKFINPDAEDVTGKLRPTIEQYRALRAKRNNTASIEKMRADVEQAKQEYFKAKDRQKNRPDVDVEGPLLRYQALLGQMQNTIAKIDGDPLMTPNTGSLTDQ
jgi:hypothetical protein